MTNTAEVAGCGLKSLALTRNVRIPRSGKKCKEKDSSIFQFLLVILRGIKGLCRDLLYIVKSLKKYCCQEINSQLINKQLTVCKEHLQPGNRTVLHIQSPLPRQPDYKSCKPSGSDWKVRQSWETSYFRKSENLTILPP